MSNLIQFGDHEGRTMEWLFFNKPHYPKWLVRKRVYGSEDCFTAEQAEHFLELYYRAKCLSGTCSECRERPVTRMGLNVPHRSNRITDARFLCGDCDYPAGRIPEYCTPSFFVETHTISWKDMKVIADAIRRHYIGTDGSLTQREMEEFFYNDANFSDPTPGFFSTPAATLKAA